MPGVVVPQMREKKDPLESIMRGLQIATQVYGLKQASDKADADEEARLEKQGEKMAEVKTRQEQERGLITPMQRAAMAKDYEEVPEGTPGAMVMAVRDAKTGQETPLFLKVRGKDEGPLTKEVGGQLVQFDPKTNKWNPVYTAPKSESSGGWTSTGQVDESGHLVLINKAGNHKQGPKVGKKPGSTPTTPEQKAAFAVAANFEGDYAKKSQISNVIDRELEKYKEFMDKGDVDGAVRHGEGMLKALNSAFGADAVGVEEAARLGGYLKPFKAPWEPGSMIGRDLDEFYSQVKAKSEALRGAAADSLAQAEKIRGGGLKAAGAGEKVAIEDPPKESPTSEGSSTPSMANSLAPAGTVAPPKIDPKIDEYAKQHKLDYTTAKSILSGRGYKPNE